MSIDRLQSLIRTRRNPTVAGLDPRVEYIPPHILKKYIEEKGETLEAAAEAFFEFNQGLIDVLWDVVPAVKPQLACYELLGPPGMEIFKKTVDYAKAAGLYVIADGKRNDIGSTAEAYSDAFLGSVRVGNTEVEPFGCDALTVNAYLGSDGVKPFIRTCRERSKAIFVLVKTSNPSSGELQDMIAGDRVVYKVVGDLAERLGKDTVGEYGYTCVGAVVGATYPSDLRDLRRRLDKTFFLVPGYGAQGGSAEDIRYAFNRFGHGAVINSSRAILCAWQKTGKNGKDYTDAAREAAVAMKNDIKSVMTIV